ncbi:MAG: hypothetical protein RRC34_13160 [Lentisphaeria bacterium]|nr:hypothetical protein [Lentisphaeria bacterium]
MVVECMVSVVLVLAAMLLMIRMVRWAANVVIILVCGGGCGFVVFNILERQWRGWEQIIVYSLATGVAAAMLTLPALPFSKFKKD